MTSTHNLRIERKGEIFRELNKAGDKETEPRDSICAMRLLEGFREDYECRCRIRNDELEGCFFCDGINHVCKNYIAYNKQEPEEMHQLDYIQEVIESNHEFFVENLPIPRPRFYIVFSRKNYLFDSIEDMIDNGANPFEFSEFRRALNHHNLGKVKEYVLDKEK